MLNRKKAGLIAAILTISMIPQQVFAQSHDGDSGFNEIFGLIELPFLLIAIVFSFLVAKRLKGGKFGKGMQLLAWGFLIMAIGHLHMQVDHLYNFNLFNTLLGNTAGRAAWFVALVATWGLSALGFLKIYKASSLG